MIIDASPQTPRHRKIPEPHRIEVKNDRVPRCPVGLGRRLNPLHFNHVADVILDEAKTFRLYFDRRRYWPEGITLSSGRSGIEAIEGRTSAIESSAPLFVFLLINVAACEAFIKDLARRAGAGRTGSDPHPSG